MLKLFQLNFKSRWQIFIVIQTWKLHFIMSDSLTFINCIYLLISFQCLVTWVELYLHSTNTPSWCSAQLQHRDNFTSLPLSFQCLVTMHNKWQVFQKHMFVSSSLQKSKWSRVNLEIDSRMKIGKLPLSCYFSYMSKCWELCAKETVASLSLHWY
jgi:hypothetical protein